MYKLIEQFYKENYNVLVKRLNRRAGGVENAEDIVQESFVRALKYKASFNPHIQEIGAWFNRIMNNVLAVHQREQMQGGLTIPYDEHEHEESYECSAETKNQVEEILSRLYKRDKHSQNILHLYFVGGFKMSEIRDVTDASYKSIQMLVHRFKLSMIEEYSDGEIQEGG